MPKVYSYLKQKKKNIIIYNSSQKVIKISTIIILQFLSIIFKNKKKSVEFFMIPDLNSNEKIILKYPEQYLWSYEKFRNRVGVEENIYVTTFSKTQELE